MPENGKYPAARKQLVSYLQNQGFRPHPREVFCPTEHCWVDVGALLGQDYWAFEYKSRTDSIQRGFDQCCSYSNAFNYVVLVADRYRVTSSPYFAQFRKRGFGVWRHHGKKFYELLTPKRQPVKSKAKFVVERQFRPLISNPDKDRGTSILNWC